ncbi:MAG: hypothetical protein IJ638_03805 [Alphaproteobacteria bacterium]|nr:hypothetical protein [Alphaproteobacteria bacterium]
MGKILDKFLYADTDKIKAGLDLANHAIPWGVGLGFFIGGVYGLESYLAIDFSKSAVENLKKNKMLSDAQKDFYTLLGNEVFDQSKGEDLFNKMKNKKFAKISDENSLLATWKSIYDK